MSDETRCPECGTKQAMPPAVRAVCEEMRRDAGQASTMGSSGSAVADSAILKVAATLSGWAKRIEEAYE